MSPANPPTWGVLQPADLVRPSAPEAQELQGFREVVLRRVRAETFGPGARYTAADLDARQGEVEAFVRARLPEILREERDALARQQARTPPVVSLPGEVEHLVQVLFGLGPLEVLLKLPGLEDIAINGPRDIYTLCGGGVWTRAEVTYPDSETLLIALNRMIARSGRQAGPTTPIVDAILPNGYRVNIVSAPVAFPWPAATIRVVRPEAFSLGDMVARGGEAGPARAAAAVPDYFTAGADGLGVLDPLAATFLHLAVIAGLNILVVGAPGVGKTSLLRALAAAIPAERRVILVEDTPEINVRGGREDGRTQNCVYFYTRKGHAGVAEVTQRDLVIAALRQRPDALTLGEARGGEVFDMLNALWTGHKNGLTSIHAHRVEDAAVRIRMMLQMAAFQTEVSEAFTATLIANSFDLVISLAKNRQGQRQVTEIAEFTGAVEGFTPVRTPLFKRTAAGRLACTGHTLASQHEAALGVYGFSYGSILQAARETGDLAR